MRSADTYIPEKVRKAACAHMTDTFSCIVSGMQEDTPKTLLTYLREKQCERGVLLLGSMIKVNVEDAALYYGICSHCCDFDDISKNLGGHPGAVILPVVLALGQEEKADGELLLRAYVTGVETAAMIGKTAAAAGLASGWNPTTLFGIFGGVAAGAVLCGLNEKELRNALGIAAGEAGGLKVNYGTAAKDLTVGHIASKAIFSIKMAKLGLDAAEDALFAEDGLLKLLTTDFEDAFLLQEIEHHESDFLKPGIILKPYPACRGMHNGIDDILEIIRKNKVDLKQVESILCKVQDTVLESNRYPIPANGVEGKFSLPYCVSVCLMNQQVTPDDFMINTPITEEMLRLMKMVKIEEDPNFTDAKSGIEVCIRMKDGTGYAARSNYAKGDPRNPMDEEEFMEKLHHCLERRLSKEDSDEVIHMWMNPETIAYDHLQEILGKTLTNE